MGDKNALRMLAMLPGLILGEGGKEVSKGVAFDKFTYATSMVLILIVSCISEPRGDMLVESLCQPCCSGVRVKGNCDSRNN